MCTSRHTRVRSRLLIMALAVGVVPGGCALVELSPTGAGVRLAKPEAVAACTNLGRVTASVVHKAGFIPRHPDAVQDNLNVTARNSAAGMGADTIVPASAIQDGKQTFDVYRCAGR
jgi:uncharacterized protein DUF4156